MADSFQSPRDQASLAALKAQLERLSAQFSEVQAQVESGLARETAAQREALAEQQAITREGVQRRSVIEDTSAASITKGTGAVEERIGAEKTLNDLIVQRVELEAQAARAAREGLGATASGTGVAAAAARVQGAVQGASPATAAEQERVIAASSVGAQTSDNFASSLERQRRAMAELDDSLTRHGALTTEWLGALGRGEVTLRDFGNQTLQTIGKFSGWAFAAGGVYAVLNALGQVRKGAIDTASAVQGLTRFIPDLNKPQAQQQIIDQATSTVTPIADVGTAANSFARIFKNQGDVFTATHVALTASKLDNIALANSYRYLTALTQEYGLSANELPGIFDQVTAAQDRLGARVSELLPALARSAAAIKNSGGDINQALALEALTIVRTGQTGNTVGTGFSRGASNFYKTPTAEATLKGFGINPNQGYTQALVEAIGKAQTLSGDDKRQISKAFFGPLRGGQLASLFNASPEQLSKFIGQTSPDASRGLAQTQLEKVTAQADQRIKELGIDLETLGASLASSGLLTDLGLLIALLNSFLQATTGLLQVYNGLPNAVKETTGGLAGLAGGLALLRRFGVVDSIQKFRKSEEAYLGSAIGSLQDQQRGLVGRGNAQASETVYYREQEAAATSAEDKAQYQALIAESEQKQKEIAARSLSVQTEITGLETELQGIKDANRAQLAAERERVRGLGAVGAGEDAGAVAGANAAATTGQVAATERLSAVQTEATLTTAELADVMGVSMVTNLGAAATAVKGFIFGIGGLAVAAGAYAAFHGASELKNQASQGVNKIDRANTIQGILDAADKARNPQGFAAHAENTLNYLFGTGQTYQDNVGSAFQNEANAKIAELGAKQDEHNAGLGALNEIYRGLAPKLADTKSSIEKIAAIREALAELGNDNALKDASPSEYAAAKQRLIKQLDALSTTKKTIQEFVETLKSAKDITNYEAGTQTVFDIQGPNSKQGYLRAAATAARIAERIGQVTDPAEIAKFVTEWKKTQEQIKQNADAALQQGLALAGTDPTAQATVRAQYLSHLQAPITATRNELTVVTNQIKATQDRIHIAQKDLNDLNSGHQSGPPTVGTALSDALGKSGLTTLISSLAPAAKKNNQVATALRQLLAQQEQDYKVAQEQMAQANEQAQQALIAAQTAYQQAGSANPVTQAQIGFQGAARELAALEKSGINDPVQRYQLLTAERQAVTQKIAAQLNQYEASQSLALSQADSGATDKQKLLNAISSASALVSHIASLGSSVDPTLLINAQKALVDAQSAYADYLKQQARDLIGALGALAESKTNNVITQAKDELDTAKKLLAYDEKNGADQNTLIKDKTDVNNKRKALNQSIIDQRLSNIQFEASIGQISTATEIQRLNNLLALAKKDHASLQTIQNIRKQIYDLTFGQGGLNLNTGSIHLPSTYEVKNAIRAGHGAAKRVTTAGLLADVKTNVNLTVYVNRDADFKKLGDTLHEALGTGVNGLAQAAGLV